ncbi:TPA: glycosyltransferase family 2 protein [Photobacterium damselae]
MIDISIVIPSFNSSNSLIRAINSCLNQNIEKLEIIVIDDGSTDNSQELVKNINDIRVKYHFKNNEGVAKARNLGIDLAQGEYIYFLDSDDYLYKDSLKELLNTVNQYDFIITGYEIKNKKNTLVYPKLDDKLSLIDNFFLDRIISSPWAKLFKLNIINKNNIRFKELEIMEDGVFNLEYIKCCKSYFIYDKITYVYDKSSEGCSSFLTSDKYKDVLKSMQYQIDIYMNIDSGNKNNEKSEIVNARFFNFTILYPLSVGYYEINKKINFDYIKNNKISLIGKILYISFLLNKKIYIKVNLLINSIKSKVRR